MKNFSNYLLILIAIIVSNNVHSQDAVISNYSIPVRLKKIDTIALLPESFRTDRPYAKGRLTFLVVLINPTKDTVKYGGYSLSSPWWRLQVLDSTQKKFIEVDQGWFCGTGLRTCVVPPGKCAYIFIRKYTWKSRIGIDYYLNSSRVQRTIWTKLIDAVNIENQ